MMRRLALVALASLTLQLALVPSLPVLAQSVGSDIREQLEPVEDVYGGNNADETTLARTVAQIIQIVLGFLGIIFLVLIVYAGFLWMTAAGNEDRISKAKQIIIAAIIGVAIILAAYAITFFVFDTLLKATGIEEGGLGN